MKKQWILCAALLCAVFLTACAPEPSTEGIWRSRRVTVNGDDMTEIVGSLQAVFADGRVDIFLSKDGGTYSGVYEEKNGSVTLTMEDGDRYVGLLNDGKLYLHIGEITAEMERQS